MSESAVEPPRPDPPVPLRRRVRAPLLRPTVALAARLPHPLVRAACAGLAGLLRHGPHGRVARENLERVYGPPAPGEAHARARLVRDVFRHSGVQLAEVLRLARGAPLDRPSWIDDAVEADASFARLEAVLARGRGALILTAHLGNWELLCAWLRRRGLDGAVVGRTRGRDDWLARVRRGYGVTTLPQDAPARRMLEVLRGGGTLGVLSDLEARRLDGAFLPFLGVDALTAVAPASLARAARTGIVPVRCVRRGDRYVLSVEEELRLDPALDRRAAVEDLAARLNDVYGRWIRETPEQWCWHQPRWRTRPGTFEPVPHEERERRRRSD